MAGARRLLLRHFPGDGPVLVVAASENTTDLLVQSGRVNVLPVSNFLQDGLVMGRTWPPLARTIDGLAPGTLMLTEREPLNPTQRESREIALLTRDAKALLRRTTARIKDRFHLELIDSASGGFLVVRLQPRAEGQGHPPGRRQGRPSAGSRVTASILSVTVLITGGGGFIGSHLAERLLARGDRVRILDSFATGRRENLAHLHEVEVIEGDIQSFERAHNAVKGCDVVLHQAALPSVPRSIQDPLTTHMVNAVGTLNVLLAARDADVRRVVYASSSSVYGANPEIPKRESLTPAPISPYAVSKLAGEGYCRAFTEIYGLECVALRYFNVFGPRQDPQSQYAAVLPKFISAMLDGRRPTVFGDGSQSRDFTYVDNVVQANLLAMDSEAGGGEVFNVAYGERATLTDALGMLAEMIGVDLEVDYLPARVGEVSHSLADVSKARNVLGYEPEVTLDEGLRRIVAAMVAGRAGAAVGTH